MTEEPDDTARPELERLREELRDMLKRSFDAIERVDKMLSPKPKAALDETTTYGYFHSRARPRRKPRHPPA
jgi:hypothetical protein